MRVLRDLETQQYFWPVKNSAAAIVDGALLMPGVTAETDLGVLIPATSACGDAIGLLKGNIASSATNTLVNGTAWLMQQVTPVVPMRVLGVPYDTSDTAAVASTSTTTVTITSLEDNIDTSYLYGVSGLAAGTLQFVATSASGSCVTKTASGWNSTSTVIKILRLFHQLAKINAASDKIGTDAAAGSWTCLILQNTISYAGSGPIVLDPTKHSGLTGLNSYGDLKFEAQVGVRNAGPYTID